MEIEKKCYFKRVIKAGISEGVMFEQRPESG